MGDLASWITQLVHTGFLSLDLHEIEHSMVVNQKVGRAINEVAIAIKRTGMYAVAE
jgi:hypothetical protein